MDFNDDLNNDFIFRKIQSKFALPGEISLYNHFNTYNDKHVKRLILSYLCIVLISLIMGLNMYSIGVDVVRDEIKQSNLFMLNEAKDTIDHELKTIQSLSYQIARNPKLNQLIKIKKPTGKFYLDAKDIIYQLSSYTTNLNFIDNYYVYLKNSDYIITCDTLYSTPLFYKQVLEYHPDQYADWCELLENHSFQGDFLSFDEFTSEGSKMITYVQSIPLSYNEDFAGAICIEFNKMNLINTFSNIDLREGGFIYIENKYGEPIVTIVENPDLLHTNLKSYLTSDINYYSRDINNEKMIITSVTSDLNDWNYYIALPSKVALTKLDYYQKLYIMIMGAFIFMGIVVATLLTYKNSKPLLMIAKQLKDFIRDDENNISKDQDKPDALDLIGSSVEQLISQNTNLQKNLKKQKPFLYAAYLDKLLKGLIYNRTELDAIANYLKVNSFDEKFLVLYVQIYKEDTIFDIDQEGIRQMAMYKAIVKNLFHCYFGEKILIHESDHQALGIIISSNEEIKIFIEETEQKIEAINYELMQEYSFKIIVGGGDIYYDLMNTWQSYEQASEAINYNIAKDHVLIWYSTIPKNSDTYYYPLDLEQHFINFVRLGDRKQVRAILQRIYDENFLQRSLSLSMTKYFISDLKSSMVKMASMIPNAVELIDFTKIDKNNSIKENFEIVEDLCMKLCDLVHSRTKNQRNQLISTIQTYINDNYMDSNLGLNKIANKFNISEGYFSQLFKEETGVNFVDYLEKIRINQSLELLKDETLSINSISGMVGYNSAQSFRRAFKRVCGTSPTGVRNNYRAGIK